MNKIDPKIRESILKILSSNKLLTLSTLGEKNQPYVCSVYYVFDINLNLYFWSEKDTKHSINLEKQNNIAVNIADSSQDWGSNIQGLQIKGKAYPVTCLRIIKPARLYMKRFPLVKKLIKNPKEFSHKFNSTLYKIEINWLKLFDETTFGKEVWKEVKL